MTDIDNEKQKLLVQLGLTWSLMSESKGQSANDKMPEIIAMLCDPLSSNRTQISICSALISWISVTPKEAIEEAMLAHSKETFDYLRDILKSGGDDDKSVPDLQTPAYYLTSCIQRQILNSSSSFRSKMIPKVLDLIKDLTQIAIYLNEKKPNGIETNATSRTESMKLLIRALPTDDDVIVSDTIVVLFPFLKLLNDKMTPILKQEVIGWLVKVGHREKSLFDNHMDLILDAVRFGEADELVSIFKGNDQIFTVIAPQILAKNFHFLVTVLGFPEIAEAILMMAKTDSGAKTLSGSVPSLMKDMDKTVAAGCLPILMVIFLVFIEI